MTTLEIARLESVAGAIARNCAGYSIAPVAMIAPWPGIRRGTDAVVPSVPGVRERDRRALEVGQLELSGPRARDDVVRRRGELGEASSPRRPGRSARGGSASRPSSRRPRRGRSGSRPRRTRVGSPLEASKASFMAGNASSARRIAHAKTCVKEIFDCSDAARCSLISRRFSSASLIGICRCVVAVGTARLASMFSAIRSAPPRIASRSPSTARPAPGRRSGGTQRLRGGTGAGAGAARSRARRTARWK